MPLPKDIGSIAVIGPNADDLLVLQGNYCGTPARATTVLEGIRRKLRRHRDDGENEDDEWVFPLANPYDYAGNDVIDAIALLQDVEGCACTNQNWSDEFGTAELVHQLVGGVGGAILAYVAQGGLTFVPLGLPFGVIAGFVLAGL